MPVASTRPARASGPRSSAARIVTALSRTPTPLTLSTKQDAISEYETRQDMAQTLSQKVWDRHLVRTAEGEPDLLYIDLHLIHEVTSPQAFDGLRLAGRPLRRPDLTLATEDHNVPTDSLVQPV